MAMATVIAFPQNRSVAILEVIKKHGMTTMLEAVAVVVVVVVVLVDFIPCCSLSSFPAKAMNAAAADLNAAQDCTEL